MYRNQILCMFSAIPNGSAKKYFSCNINFNIATIFCPANVKYQLLIKF